MLKFEKFNGGKLEWNKYCENLGDNDFRQTFDWGEYLHSTGWNVERLIFKENNEVKFCVQYIYKKLWPIYTIYLPSGLIGDNKYIEYFLNKIKKKYKNYFIYLRIDIRKETKEENLEKLLELGLTRTIYSIRSREHMKVFLKREINEILKNTKQKWRYNYRKALKKNIIIQTIVDINPNEIFDLCKDLSKFKKIRYLYNLNELQEFKNRLGNYIHCVRAIDNDSNVLGYYICIIYKDIAYQIFNAVNERGNKLMAGYTILFHVIESLKKKNIKELDIGEINKKRYPGNFQFKSSFNQKIFQVIGEYEWSSNIVLKYLINFYMYLIKA